MDFRCPVCKKIYSGKLEQCPHCGASLSYNDETPVEVIVEKSEVENQVDLVQGKISGPVHILNVVYLLGLLSVLLAGLFAFFAPVTPLAKGQPPFAVALSFPAEIKILLSYAFNLDDSYYSVFMEAHRFFPIAVILDSMHFVISLVVIISTIYPIIKTLIAIGTGGIVAFMNPKLNKNKILSLSWGGLLMFAFYLALALVGRRLLCPELTIFPAMIYIPTMVLVFSLVTLVLKVIAKILRNHVKVVLPPFLFWVFFLFLNCLQFSLFGYVILW